MTQLVWPNGTTEEPTRSDGYGPRETSQEVWKEVPGYGGSYEVSDLGRVRSVDRLTTRSDGVTRLMRGRVLKDAKCSQSGHRSVSLMDEVGSARSFRVHTLVLMAFVGARPDGMEACHFDDDPSNNILTNLRWGTRSINTKDRVRNGTHQMSNRTHCPHGHAYVAWNLERSTLRAGRRRCLGCTRARSWARKRGLAFCVEKANEYYERERLKYSFEQSKPLVLAGGFSAARGDAR